MRFEWRRQDIVEDCEHENPRFCKTKDGWHYIPAWHVWDNERNDYAEGTGPGEFDRARDAREHARYLNEKEQVAS